MLFTRQFIIIFVSAALLQSCESGGESSQTNNFQENEALAGSNEQTGLSEDSGVVTNESNDISELPVNGGATDNPPVVVDNSEIDNGPGEDELAFADQQAKEKNNVKIEKMDIVLPSISTSPVNIASTSSATTGNGLSRVQEKVVVNVFTDVWPKNNNIGVYFEFDAASRARFNHSCYFSTGQTCSTAPICNINMSNAVCNDLIGSTIVEWANDWSMTSSIRFEFVTSVQDADMRVGFMDTCGDSDENCGSWAALGYQQQKSRVSSSSTSINFDWLTKDVVLHEFGHALGLAHEQSHPRFPVDWNMSVAVPYFARTLGWNRDKVEFNVTKRVNGPYISVGKYDPFSIMQYQILKKDPVTDQFLITNPEDCPSPDQTWCIQRNSVLSTGDRDGIASLYPTIASLYGDIELGSSEYVVYAPNVDGRTHLLAFNTLDQNIQDDVLNNGNGQIELKVQFVNASYDSNCFLGFGSKYLVRENYRFTMTHVDSNAVRTTVKTIPIALTGKISVGCGFTSANAGRFGKTASLSTSIANSLR